MEDKFLGQGPQAGEAFEEGPGIAPRKVGAAHPVHEEDVSGEEGPAEEEADSARRVARRVEGADLRQARQGPVRAEKGSPGGTRALLPGAPLGYARAPPAVDRGGEL